MADNTPLLTCNFRVLSITRKASNPFDVPVEMFSEMTLEPPNEQAGTWAQGRILLKATSVSAFDNFSPGKCYTVEFRERNEGGNDEKEEE